MRSDEDTASGADPFVSRWYQQVTAQYIVGRGVTGAGALVAIGIAISRHGITTPRVVGIAVLLVVNITIGVVHRRSWPRVGVPPRWLQFSIAGADVATVWAMTLVEPALVLAALFVYVAIASFHAAVSGFAVGLTTFGLAAVLVLSTWWAEIAASQFSDPFVLGALTVSGLFGIWVGGTFSSTQRATLAELGRTREEMLDATRRAQAREADATRAATDLEEARDRLLRNAAHHLRTPVTGVQGALELLTERWEGLSARRRQRLLSIATGSADDLAHMTEQLLDLMRLDEGLDARFLAAVPIGDVLRHGVARLQRQLVDHPVTIDVPDGLMVVTSVDSLDRIIGEILSNVARHTPAGTATEIRARREGDSVAIDISDDGGGIPPDVLNNVGEPIVRPEDAPQNASGLGIGLALVKRHADRLGGTFEATNTPSGAHLRIGLPALVRRDVRHEEPSPE